MPGFITPDGGLPYSLDAEQAVLGSVLLDSSNMEKISDQLVPENFHVGLHKDLYSVMLRMFVTGLPIDIVTVIELAVRQKVFDDQGEARTYLVKLMENVVSPSSIVNYAVLIREKAMVRQLMYASKEIYELAGGGSEEPQHILDFAETKIYEIRSEKEIKGLSHIRPTVIERIKELSELSQNPENANFRGLSTSFSGIDKVIYGLNPSDLILIAGRPSMGKTTLGVNVAVNVAKNYPEKKVAVFSLEMSKEQLVSRIIQSEAKITSDQMKNGNISRSDWKNISEAAEILTRIEVYIDDTASISIGEMKAKLRRLKNLGAVVIDYLQLMSTGRKDGNRVNEISEITRNIKIMAKELNVPVILCSQLSRGPESRQDKRPMLSDLRESGSIEQDADIVMFIYRNSYYNKDDEQPNAAECIIAKNRHGETTTVGLNFEGQFFRFTGAEYVHVNEH